METIKLALMKDILQEGFECVNDRVNQLMRIIILISTTAVKFPKKGDDWPFRPAVPFSLCYLKCHLCANRPEPMKVVLLLAFAAF